MSFTFLCSNNDFFSILFYKLRWKFSSRFYSFEKIFKISIFFWDIIDVNRFRKRSSFTHKPLTRNSKTYLEFQKFRVEKSHVMMHGLGCLFKHITLSCYLSHSHCSVQTKLSLNKFSYFRGFLKDGISGLNFDALFRHRFLNDAIF